MPSDWNDIAKETEKVDEYIKTKTDDVFTPIKDIIKKRALKVAIYGDFSTGKSYFGLTAPAPVFCIDTEDGIAPISKNFKDKDIRVVRLNEIDKIKSERDGVLNHEKLKQILLNIVNLPAKDKPKTILFDSISDLYDIIQDYIKVDYHNLKPEQKFTYRFDWGQVNNVYRHTMQKLVNLNINLIFTGRASPVYDGKGQVVIGSYYAKWQGLTPSFVDVVIFNKKKYNPKTKMTSFISIIEKCRMNKELIGQEFENLTFDKLTEIINER